MSFSDFWENAILNHIFGKSVYTPPENIFVGFSTTDPGDDGSGLFEPSGSGYARVETSPSDWSEAVAGVLENLTDITFPQPTGNWGLISHIVLFDAVAGGNLLGSAPVVSPRTIDGTSTAPNFVAGTLKVYQT